MKYSLKSTMIENILSVPYQFILYVLMVVEFFYCWRITRVWN